MAAGEELIVDIWADMVCPWCYIGERRLLAALAERPELVPLLRWRPFQLQPQMPPEGIGWRAFAEEKFGGWEQAQAAFAQVTRAGASDDIMFNFERIHSVPNTVDAHRILLLAQERGILHKAAESCFGGYFTEGANLNDYETLVRLAVRGGLGEKEAQAYLGTDTGFAEVQSSQHEAEEMGITGVPFVVFNGRYAVPGAVSVVQFGQAMDAAVKEGIWA